MKTAERETPNRRPQCVANRADGAASQYRSCSIMWAAKQENFQPAEKCFFLTSPFIEQCVANRADGAASQYRSCSIMWAAKQENFQPAEKCFFLTSPFIELTGVRPVKLLKMIVWRGGTRSDRASHRTLPTRQSGEATNRSGALGKCIHARKSGAETARPRRICQHKVERA